jgi:hypothetical protein
MTAKNLTSTRIRQALDKAGIAHGENTHVTVEGREAHVFIPRKITGDDGVEVDSQTSADERTKDLVESVCKALEDVGYLTDVLWTGYGGGYVRQGRVKTAAEEEIDALDYCHPANRAHY